MKDNISKKLERAKRCLENGNTKEVLNLLRDTNPEKLPPGLKEKRENLQRFMEANKR